MSKAETRAILERALLLPPDEQYSLALIVANNVGMVLVNEPEHPDSPHIPAVSDETGRGLTIAWAGLDDKGDPMPNVMWFKEPGEEIKKIHAAGGVEIVKVEIRTRAAPVAQEPVAWQWRYKGPSLAVDDDCWSAWLPIEYSIESFRETFADKIERGTVEYRPLYAAIPPAPPAGGR